MRVRPSGDRALLVEVDDLDEVLALHAALAQDPPAGVLDLVPAARTVLVVLDDTAGPHDLARVREALGHLRPGRHARTDGPVVEVPVVYDGEDLGVVAAHLGCTEADVVARHTGERWTVAFGGFAPGFGYCTGTRRHWDVPRRATPRTRVPAGSVGLAGEYSGVYPRASPGGWQLLGRALVEVWDPDRDPPALLAPGTRVRFVEAAR